MQTNSFLSTSVRTLLECVNSTVASNDYSNEYLTNAYTFNWESIGRILKDKTGSQEPPEIASRSKAWFVDTITALVPVFDTAQRLCQNAATQDNTVHSRLVDLWKWTDSSAELSQCLEDCFGQYPRQTSAVESMLVITAILERAVGNVLRRNSLPVPFLLRDLLLEQLLIDTFDEVPVLMMRLLVGMPSAINARNLVWHGFVAPNQLAPKIPATLLVLLASLGEICNVDEVPYFKTESQFPGIEELPLIMMNDLDEFQSMLLSYTVIPPQFVSYWSDAFQRYSEERYGRCLVLLLPQLELILRIGFCVCNACPKRLLTAVQSAPHTTLDDMLVETIDGKPNALCKELGEGLLDALFDLLQRPPGPRIRDRLGHGECALDDVPQNLAAVMLSLSLAIAARLSNQPFSQASVWDNYKACFHPATLLLKMCHQVLNLTDKVKRAVDCASSLTGAQNGDINSMGGLQKSLTSHDPMETARSSLDVQPATLFRPRQEIIATVALLRTLRSLCVALDATRLEMERRSSDLAEGRLRSRQRRTFQRMIHIAPSVAAGGICLIIMAVRIRNAVAETPEELIKWQRCLRQMEKYTEKLASCAHGTRSRWEEARALTSDFHDTVLPYFTKQD